VVGRQFGLGGACGCRRGPTPVRTPAYIRAHPVGVAWRTLNVAISG
jgi:hypothetical protein